MVIKNLDKDAQRSPNHVYTWKDSGPLISVTSVLSKGVPKPALINWAKKRVAEIAVEKNDLVQQMIADDPKGAIDWLKQSPYRERDAAADLGSLLHDIAEAHVLEAEYPAFTPEVKPMVEQFLQFLQECKPEFYAAEVIVYNMDLRYAGTLDGIADFNDPAIKAAYGFAEDRPIRLLIDYKTGKGVYAETALQLAAYRHANFIGMANGGEIAMPAVDGAAVVHIRPDKWELIPVEAGEREFAYFTRALWIADWQSDGYKGVVGKAIKRGKA